MITHGEAAAREARAAAAAAVRRRGRREDVEALPTTAIPRARLEAGIAPAELFTDVGLTPSRGEAKRLIKQGGLYVNDERIESLERLLTIGDVRPGRHDAQGGQEEDPPDRHRMKRGQASRIDEP